MLEAVRRYNLFRYVVQPVAVQSLIRLEKSPKRGPVVVAAHRLVAQPLIRIEKPPKTGRPGMTQRRCNEGAHSLDSQSPGYHTLDIPVLVSSYLYTR